MNDTNQWPKIHYCGKKITPEDWKQLDYVGLQEGDASIMLPDLELRNCACGSTIAIVVKREEQNEINN